MQPFIRILVRVAVTSGIVLLLTGLLIVSRSVFLPTYRKMCALENRCQGLRGRVDAKQHEIHQIRENEGRLLSDPDFVARIAHENRRVFPNELVFVFDDK